MNEEQNVHQEENIMPDAILEERATEAPPASETAPLAEESSSQEETTAESHTLEQPVVADVPTKRNCTQCGAEVSETQIFCPYCGQKNEILHGGEVSDAIAQFNQKITKKEKKKKGRKKFFVIFLIVLALLGGAFFGAYKYFEKKADVVIEQLKVSLPTSAEVKKAYNDLTPLGQFMHRGRIIDVFIDVVSDNKYTTSANYVVNTTSLRMYDRYAAIAAVLNIDDSADGTNIIAHINAVLKLKEYEQYNGVQLCILKSGDNYKKCLEYINEAADSSYWLMDYYFEFAYDYAKDALKIAQANTTGDALCKKYINALEDLKDGLAYLYLGIYSHASEVTTANSTIVKIIDDILEATDAVKQIIDDIPTIKKR